MSPLRRLIPLAAIALVTPLGFLASAPTTAHAISCLPGNNVRGDLNGDGIADVVVGVPSYDADQGAVDITYSSGVRLFLSASDLGLSSAAGDRFGESVAVRDINGDGCDDLAIGAPGTNSSKGAVHLVRGNANSTLSLMTTHLGTAAHGSFGAQVLLPNTNRQLVASAPTTDVGGHFEAGAVTVIPLTTSGTAAARVTITQDSPGIPGASENGDRWGTALAGGSRTIVVGTPDEAVGTLTRAGAVTFLTATAANPTTFAGVAITQNSTGIPGTAERNDQFGAAVAFQDNRVLIGVPGEDIGTDSNTGQVTALFYNSTTRTYSHLKTITQDSSGIPGTNEDNDLFGSSVALGVNTLDQLTGIVGAPGEAIGSVANAGAVTLFRVNVSGGLTASFRQGVGASGTPEAGDRFGASVSVLGGNENDGEAMMDGLVVGVPGEDVGAIGDAGVVSFTRNGTNWFTLLLEDTGAADVPANAQYGEVLAAAAGRV